MWWPTHARLSLGEAERVLQLGAAGEDRSRERRAAARCAPGTYAARAPDQQRRRVGRSRARATRTTESSVRVWIGRSWTSERVGDRPRAGACVVVARRRSARRRRSPDVITRARRRRRAAGGGAASTAASRRGRATAARPRPRPRPPVGACAITIGRSRPGEQRLLRSRSARPARAPPRASAAISANGLSSRCLRARRRATARSSAARQARW